MGAQSHGGDRVANSSHSRSGWGFAVVVGQSMAPTLNQGDRLLVHYGVQPRPGQIVVARFVDGTVAVKRAARDQVTRTGEPGWWLASDNPEQGVDSRHRGPVPAGEVLAVVLARVWPRPRPL